MGIVCRPLLLYNEFLPAEISEREKDWEYQAFGHYDGISIGEKVILKDMSDLSPLFEQGNRYETSGTYFTHVLWGFYGNEEEEEEFWKTDAPFIYICLLQLSEDTRATLEKPYNNTGKALQKDGVRCLLYHSLDNSDLILVIKSEAADGGFDVINDLHYEQRREYLKFRNTYSILGVRRSVIDSDMNRIQESDIVAMAELQIIEKERERTELLYQEIKQELIKRGYGDGVIWRKSVLGTEDDVIFIRNISWRTLLSFYKKGSGFLCNSNICTQDYVYAVSTRILYKENTETHEVSRAGVATKMNLKRPFCDMLAQFVNSSGTDFSDTEKKNLLMLVNAFRRFEYTNREERPFSDYNFFPLFLPFYQFISLSSDKEGDCVSYYYNFMKCMKLCTQNFVKPERIYSQITDFNIKYFDMPIKFITLYSAYIYAIKQVLNVRDKEDTTPATTYEFLICAGLNDDVEVLEMFPCRENSTKRLFLVKTPEKHMYNIKSMFFALGHETAHFVGKKIRNREVRYDCILAICAQMIGRAMKSYYEFGERADKGGVVQAVNVKAFEREMQEWIKHGTSLKKEEWYVKDVINFKRVKQANIEASIAYNKQYEYHAEVLKGNLSVWIKELLSSRGIELLSFMISDEYDKDLASGTVYEWELFYKRKKSHLQHCINAFLGVTVNPKTTLSLEFILDNVLYLMKECYADVICILLLNLSVEDYISSMATFSKMEPEESDAFNGSKLLVRIALVLATMNQPLENVSGAFRWGESEYRNRDKWSNDCRELYENAYRFVNMYINQEAGCFNAEEYVTDPWRLFNDTGILVQFVGFLCSCSEKFYRYVSKDNCSLRYVKDLYRMQNESDVNTFFTKMLNVFQWYEDGVNDIMNELITCNGMGER